MKTKITFLFALLISTCFAGQRTSVADLIKNASKLDKKPVNVKGKVAEFKQKISKAGNPYATFRLKGDNAECGVYFKGKLAPAPKDGATVEVSGVFAKEKKIGKDFTVKNEIDATPVKGKRFGVSSVK